MIKIAITDDHNLFRKSLCLLLSNFEEMEVVFEASNGKELLDKMANNPIDLVILDLQMDEMDGFEASQKITQLYPDVKILILTLLNEKETIRKVMEIGIHGYFTKNADPQELRHAINRLNENGFYFESSLKDVVAQIVNSKDYASPNELVPITDRELEIIKLAVKELNGKEIADTLFISYRTVEKHKKNLMEKIGAKNFTGVILYALANEYITIHDIKDN